MSSKGLLVAVVCAALGTPMVGPATRKPQPPDGRPTYVACPGAIPRPPVHPSRSVSPELATAPAEGGELLKTDGLTIPPRAARPPAATAVSWVVADLDSGVVLGGCGPHQYGRPASVQKLLLAATMLAKVDPARVIEVTAADMEFEPGSSAVGLVEGGRYRVDTLWLGLLLNSGNDAANVLARLGGGSAAAGVRKMNAEARRLGAFHTHAATPSGLDGPGQVTTAYDLALIARACFARADFRRYVSARQAWIPAQPHLRRPGYGIQNDNQLLLQYPGALGGKTGYTDLARHSFVGAAKRNGRRLMVTLLGADAYPQRGWQQGAALLDWGFAVPRGAAVGRLVTPAEAAPPRGAPAASQAPPPVAARARPASAAGGWSPLSVTSVTAVGGGLLLVTLLGWWRIRRTTRSRPSG
jgi:D-alanyl-D-alanine carboxypeptidase (penicillin-binding protein 5/6)